MSQPPAPSPSPQAARPPPPVQRAATVSTLTPSKEIKSLPPHVADSGQARSPANEQSQPKPTRSSGHGHSGSKSLGPDKILKVKVKEARNLAAKDSNGLSDPYVVIKVQSQHHKTRFVPMTLNPQWNEKLVFTGLDTLTTAIGVTVELWDHDTLKDDFMGETLIMLDRSHGNVEDGVLGSAKLEGWFPLKPRAGKTELVSGEVYLKLDYRSP